MASVWHHYGIYMGSACEVLGSERTSTLAHLLRRQADNLRHKVGVEAFGEHVADNLACPFLAALLEPLFATRFFGNKLPPFGVRGVDERYLLCTPHVLYPILPVYGGYIIR